jgi:lipoprotein-anchoring transpeptidase ErfK/SrfK
MRLTRKKTFITAVVILAAVPGAAKIIGRDSARAVASPPTSTLRLEADLSERRLKMYEADTLVWQYPISPGQAAYPTPPGNYLIKHLVWNPSWTPPPNAEWAKKYTKKEPGDEANPMKVVKIFFKEPDYYIHGTGDINSLGKAESHGCLRMDPEHVAEVAKFVMEHGGEPRDENWFWRIIHFHDEEKSIYLKNPVPLTVRS